MNLCGRFLRSFLSFLACVYTAAADAQVSDNLVRIGVSAICLGSTPILRAIEAAGTDEAKAVMAKIILRAKPEIRIRSEGGGKKNKVLWRDFVTPLDFPWSNRRISPSIPRDRNGRLAWS